MQTLEKKTTAQKDVVQVLPGYSIAQFACHVFLQSILADKTIFCFLRVTGAVDKLCVKDIAVLNSQRSN